MGAAVASLFVGMTSSQAGEVDAKGSVASTLRVGVVDCGQVADCRFLDFQDLIVVGGQLDVDVVPDVPVRLDAALRLHPIQGAGTLEDTQFVNQIQFLSVDLNEAWVGIEEVLGTDIDLRVGQQRFAWGTGLGIQPTDVVNPVDLRDPTRFDQRLGTPAVSLLWAKGKANLEVVYTPLFRPARMPVEVNVVDSAAELFDVSDIGGEGVEIGDFESRTVFPDGRIGFAGVGGRFAFATRAVDVSVMAYNGYDSIPQAGGDARIIGFQTDNDRVDIGVPLLYPELFIAGGDLRAPLPGDLGFWAEGVAIFPERTTVSSSRDQLENLVRIGTLDEVPDPLPETVVQNGRVYPRTVVGIDRAFGRVLVSAQWIHGLPTERSAPDVRDYAALGAGIAISDVTRLDLSAISDFEGVLGTADLSVLHRDAATLTLGTTVITGASGSALGDLRSLTHVRGGVSVVF
ncbi:MAG: hypothetical protein ACJAZO_005172 [Myxococcota bacterium]|jgi:hypothetical protein